MVGVTNGTGHQDLNEETVGEKWRVKDQMRSADQYYLLSYIFYQFHNPGKTACGCPEDLLRIWWSRAKLWDDVCGDYRYKLYLLRFPAVNKDLAVDATLELQWHFGSDRTFVLLVRVAVRVRHVGQSIVFDNRTPTRITS